MTSSFTPITAPSEPMCSAKTHPSRSRCRFLSGQRKGCGDGDFFRNQQPS